MHLADALMWADTNTVQLMSYCTFMPSTIIEFYNISSCMLNTVCKVWIAGAGDTSITRQELLSDSPFYVIYWLSEYVTLAQTLAGSGEARGDAEEEVSRLIVWPSSRVPTADETFGATCLFRFHFFPNVWAAASPYTLHKHLIQGHK